MPHSFEQEIATDSASAAQFRLDLRPIFNSHEFCAHVAVGVIVEGYGRLQFGAGRRKYHEEFSEPERELLNQYHTKLKACICTPAYLTKCRLIFVQSTCSSVSAT